MLFIVFQDFLKRKNLGDEPFKISQFIINFAAIVNKLCIRKPEHINSFRDIAHMQCQEDNIVGDFGNVLITNLHVSFGFTAVRELIKRARIY